MEVEMTRQEILGQDYYEIWKKSGIAILFDFLNFLDSKRCGVCTTGCQRIVDMNDIPDYVDGRCNKCLKDKK